MSQSMFHVRPLDTGKGWAIDEYDGRGAWQRTIPIGPDGSPMDKQQAQRAVFQLRRKAVNSAPATEPVNKKCQCAGPDYEAAMGHLPGCFFAARNRNDVACADVADSTDPRLLIKVAHQHWWGIGWPEDKLPIALLERAMELLDGSVSRTDADRTEAV